MEDTSYLINPVLLRCFVWMGRPLRLCRRPGVVCKTLPSTHTRTTLFVLRTIKYTVFDPYSSGKGRGKRMRSITPRPSCAWAYLRVRSRRLWQVWRSGLSSRLLSSFMNTSFSLFDRFLVTHFTSNSPVLY